MNIDGRVYLGTAIAAAVASAALLIAMPTSEVDGARHGFSLVAPASDADTQGIVWHESSVGNGIQVPRQWPARAPTRLTLARTGAESK
jgi:hypothetical protein